MQYSLNLFSFFFFFNDIDILSQEFIAMRQGGGIKKRTK